jgi:hypothetical protein
MLVMKYKYIAIKASVICTLGGLVIFAGFGINGCNKLVTVPEPISSVTATQVFSTDATATSAMLGIYSYMSTEGPSWSNFYTALYPARSADELTDETSGNESQDPYLSNTLTPELVSQDVSANFWAPLYYDIYNANAIIAGVQASTGMSASVKVELMGEAKFIRAFCYFYLTNIFGDVPLDLDINFNNTVLLAKTPQAGIYKQIIADLTDAENSLPPDFSLSGGLPIRANKWAAMALMARVDLYQGQWSSADSAATAVINSGLFRLVALDSVFLANSAESILQLQTSNALSPYATFEGSNFIPFAGGWSGPNPPTYWLTSQLLGAFEANDNRRTEWVDSNNSAGTYLYYPYKYQSISATPTTITENYTLLRIAEQYLIRAEACAQPNSSNLVQAIADVDTIRSRAGLAPTTATTQPDVLAAIQHEKRIEFFAEWGHRWFDLKRWGLAIDTLGNIPYKEINSTQLFYPIPMNEIQTDPNLVQNPGYH